MDRARSWCRWRLVKLSLKAPPSNQSQILRLACPRRRTPGFCRLHCWLDRLSFDSTWPDSLGPGDRLRPTQTQRSTVRFSVLFSRNHARISRENTRPDGNSREMRRYSLPAAALCSGDIIFHRDGPPLAKGDSILHSSTNGRGVLRLLYGSPPLPLASSFSNKTPARFKRRGENRTPSSPVINPARPSSTSHPSPRRARCRKQVTQEM